jgi:hypothetical protein
MPIFSEGWLKQIKSDPDFSGGWQFHHYQNL